MPYIAKSEREAINPLLDRLAKEICSICKEKDPTHFAGILNYACTRLTLLVLPERRYWSLALVVGVFTTLIEEFKRRVVNPYEDGAIARNGDVPEYHEEAVPGKRRR